MTIAFDAFTAQVAAADPQSISHTPAGAPGAALVALSHTTTPNDLVSSVQYGGIGLARLGSITNPTNLGRSYLYFGNGIPAGVQSVDVDRTEGTTSIQAVVITLTGALQIEQVGATLTLSANQADPQLVLPYAGRTCLGVTVIFSGKNTVGGLVELAGLTRVHDTDFGGEVGIVTRQTAVGAVDLTIGWTGTADQVGMIAAAFSEIVSAGLPVVRARHRVVNQAPTRASRW